MASKYFSFYLFTILLFANVFAIPVDEDNLLEVIRQQENRINHLEELVKQLRPKTVIKNEDLKIKSNSYSAKALGPTDCLDLWRGEQNVPGYYPVVNNDKLRFVYCNRDELVEVDVGYVDVKSSPTHFFVGRSGEFKNGNDPITITYPNTITYHPNMDASGRFTAPITGVYQFSFYGFSYTRSVAGESTSQQTRVTLIKNSSIDLAWNFADSDNPTEATLAFTAVVNMNAGEWVETRFDYGNIRECHFTGIMLEGNVPSNAY